jgi:CubicO group peptidase (beta-lactamase class C family)
MVEQLTKMPLLAQPGAEWNYSVATDVLGHLVAVISGQPFDEFLQHRIIGPLGMVNTAFEVPEAKLSRLAANYRPGETPTPAAIRITAPTHTSSAPGRSFRTALPWRLPP